MDLGFDRPLYLLPFDHRESFKNRMFGWQGPLTGDQTAHKPSNKITRDQAVLDIARRYSGLVDTFQSGKRRAA